MIYIVKSYNGKNARKFTVYLFVNNYDHLFFQEIVSTNIYMDVKKGVFGFKHQYESFILK